MPGCLGLDAMWQLVGFFLGWMKAPGKGRAISVGEVKFSDMVTPAAKKITFKIDIKKVLMRKRSEEHTSELQSLMRISYAVFCLKKKKNKMKETKKPRINSEPMEK